MMQLNILKMIQLWECSYWLNLTKLSSLCLVPYKKVISHFDLKPITNLNFGNRRRICQFAIKILINKLSHYQPIDVFFEPLSM